MCLGLYTICMHKMTDGQLDSEEHYNNNMINMLRGKGENQKLKYLYYLFLCFRIHHLFKD